MEVDGQAEGGKRYKITHPIPSYWFVWKRHADGKWRHLGGCGFGSKAEAVKYLKRVLRTAQALRRRMKRGT